MIKHILTFTLLLLPIQGLLAQDSLRLMTFFQELCAPEMAGRETGTEGNQLARELILNQMKSIGLQPLNGSYTLPMQGRQRIALVNVVGVLIGSTENYILVGAHYDHIGQRDDKIFFGCDDNASGVAAMMHIAAKLGAISTQHTIVFVAFDAEEKGLQGSSAWVADPPLPLEKCKLMLNMDMVSKNDQNEIFVAGTSHHPTFRPMIEAVNTKFPNIKVRFGHDRKNVRGEDDWTFSSDHGPFHAKGIPFLYFGVEDHPHYHQPSDKFENSNFSFYFNTAQLISELLLAIDKSL